MTRSLSSGGASDLG